MGFAACVVQQSCCYVHTPVMKAPHFPDADMFLGLRSVRTEVAPRGRRLRDVNRLDVNNRPGNYFSAL